MTWSIQTLQERLERRDVRVAEVIDEALARAEDVTGEGGRVFTLLMHDEARECAREQNISGQYTSAPLRGMPVSVKDLFDVAGQVTTAGSTALLGRSAAKRDASAIARLREAGAILVGRTNMTEFAYSGVGINPHYGTPANLYEREANRIPGGSSSGAAVSVTDRMAVAAIGSDTGGSVRIPAALCGLTGFKPTQRRVPRDGMMPLSTTLDCVGVIAPTVRCCNVLDSVLTGERRRELSAPELRQATFVVPTNHFVQGLEPAIANSFARALSLVSKAGARLVEREFSEVDAMLEMNMNGGFAAAESFRFHAALQADMEQYDPLVRERILRGQSISDDVSAAMVRERNAMVSTFASVELHNGILMPTVPMAAPQMDSLKDAAEFRRVNAALLRNPSFANYFDLCSISIPCHRAGEAPAGIMLTGHSGSDRDLLQCALAVEETVTPETYF